MRRLLALAPALLLAATACGARVAGGDQGGDGVAGIGGDGGRGSVPSGAQPGGGSTAPGGATASPGTITGSPSARTFDTMPLTLTLNRTCARPGDAMEATARTLSFSKLAFAAYYLRDNDFVPDIHYVPAEANPTGTYTWRFLLRPTTPEGDARVTAVAAKDRRGASEDAAFVVKTAC